MTAPSVFPLSSKFTLEYLLCEDDLDSESISPCSGLRPSSVRSRHWRPSLPGPRVAVVLFSPAARRASSNPCAGCTDPWGAHSSGPGPAATSLRPTPPPGNVHSSLCTAHRCHCSLSPDLLCIPTCWPHAWWAFLSSGLLPSTLSPRLDTRSSTASPGGAHAASLSAGLTPAALPLPPAQSFLEPPAQCPLQQGSTTSQQLPRPPRGRCPAHPAATPLPARELQP